MKSPCCDVELVEVDGSNLDRCPKCDRWYLVNKEHDVCTEAPVGNSSTISEVI